MSRVGQDSLTAMADNHIPPQRGLNSPLRRVSGHATNKAVNRSRRKRGFWNYSFLAAARLPPPFVDLTIEDSYIVWVRFTPEYLAGAVAGFGLALFCLFLGGLTSDLNVSGLFRPALGLLGIALLVFGGIWKIRLQSRQ